MSHNDLCGTIPVSGSFSHLQAKRYDFETEAYHSDNIAFEGTWFAVIINLLNSFIWIFLFFNGGPMYAWYGLTKVLLVCVCVMQFWEQPSSQRTWAGRLRPLRDVMPLETACTHKVSSRNGLLVSPFRVFHSEEKAITACNGDDRSAAVWLGWGELYPVMDVESCIEVIYNSRRRFGEGCVTLAYTLRNYVHDAQGQTSNLGLWGCKNGWRMTLLTPPRPTLQPLSLVHFCHFMSCVDVRLKSFQVVAFIVASVSGFMFRTFKHISQSTSLFSF